MRNDIRVCVYTSSQSTEPSLISNPRAKFKYIFIRDHKVDVGLILNEVSFRVISPYNKRYTIAFDEKWSIFFNNRADVHYYTTRIPFGEFINYLLRKRRNGIRNQTAVQRQQLSSYEIPKNSENTERSTGAPKREIFYANRFLS